MYALWYKDGGDPNINNKSVPGRSSADDGCFWMKPPKNCSEVFIPTCSIADAMLTHTMPNHYDYISLYILEAKGGGRKLALQNGKVEGSEVGKNTALFLEAGVKSPLYVALCPDPPAREEREERRKDERQRGEREREREREMREMR